MRIRKSNPKRANFRARHNCDNPYQNTKQDIGLVELGRRVMKTKLTEMVS